MVSRFLAYTVPYGYKSTSLFRNSLFRMIAKNRTAIVVCRRMLQAVADKRTQVQWVKVKGHSHEEGNDAADRLAGYAQAGQTKNEQDMSRCCGAVSDRVRGSARVDNVAVLAHGRARCRASLCRQAKRALVTGGLP